MSIIVFTENIIDVLIKNPSCLNPARNTNKFIVNNHDTSLSINIHKINSARYFEVEYES